MRKSLVVVLLALMAAYGGFWSPAVAQEATPAATPAAEPAEEGIAPVTAVESRGVTRITVMEKPVNESFIDLVPEGESPGDVLVFANPIFDVAGEKMVGLDQGSCVIARPLLGVWECRFTTVFREGQVMVAGPFGNRPSSKFAVVGGTGAYMGASGQMTLTVLEEGGYTFAFELLLD